MLGEGLDAGVRGAGLLQGNAEGEGEPHNYERDRCGDPGSDADRDRRLRRGRAARAQAPGARRQRRGAVGRHPGDVRRGPWHAAAVRPRGIRRDGRRRLRRLPGVRADGPDRPRASPPACWPRSWAAIRSRVGGTESEEGVARTGSRTEGLLFAYGATEPEAGSDLGALRTTATPVVEDGRVDRLPDHRSEAVDLQRRRRRRVLDPGHGARGALLVRGRTRAAGFEHGKPEDKHGIRASNTAALVAARTSSWTSTG